MKNVAIILASGIGSRYGSELPKQFIEINGKTILEYSVEAFENNSKIDEIVLVITPEYRTLAEQILDKNNYKKVVNLINGGTIRKESSFLAIESIKEKEANVLIHDCARPLVSQKIINDCIKALDKYSAVGVAIESSDTLIEIENGIIKTIPDRKKIKRIQTPQCFKLSIIKKAHELSKNDINFTDDCGLVLKHNLSDIYIVDGDANNIKITYPIDFYVAQKILGE